YIIYDLCSDSTLSNTWLNPAHRPVNQLIHHGTVAEVRNRRIQRDRDLDIPRHVPQQPDDPLRRPQLSHLRRRNRPVRSASLAVPAWRGVPDHAPWRFPVGDPAMNALRRFFTAEEDAGQALIVFAILMLALLFLIGLAIDAGQLYSNKRMEQEAADSAAFAGAVILYQGGTGAQAIDAATADATTNGYTTDDCTFTSGQTC